jgi:hypothetical protein
MENDKVYLVITTVDYHSGKANSKYHGDSSPHEFTAKVSSRASYKDIAIPLWFYSEADALRYIEKANSDTEREFYVIQEFTHPRNTILKDEAKIIFHCKSDEWIVIQEGQTERRPNMWANVRTISVCDKAAAEDYVRRFNEDAAAAFELSRKGAL